jgi:dienelactone hydrolase
LFGTRVFAVACFLALVACKDSSTGGSEAPVGTEIPVERALEKKNPAWCSSDGGLEQRRNLIEAVGLEGRPSDWGGEAWVGDPFVAEGYSMRPVRWEHPWGADQAFGVWFEPEPRPPGPLPLLVNVHGHWDAGVESGEVLFRSELFAREGWAVLSVSTRGSEQGDGGQLPWRGGHFDLGLHAEMRERSFGRTPLGWNVSAAHRGLDLALEGRLGAGPTDRDRVGLVGASGGAEIAAVLAAVEGRVGALVLGAYEYSFGSQEGGAACSCGVVKGGGDASQAATWLALGACRFGRSSEVRPTLLWDGQPDSGRSETLLQLGNKVERRIVAGVHGFNPSMAAASWSWMSEALLGLKLEPRDEDVARSATQQSWDHIPPSFRPEWPEGLKGAGLVSGTKLPWETEFSIGVPRVRSLLGLGGTERREDPGAEWLGTLEDDAITIERATAIPDGSAWLVVLGRGPALAEPGKESLESGLPHPSFNAREAQLDGVPIHRLRALDAPAAFGFLLPRTETDPGKDSSVTRWGLERGSPPLGLSVHDVLEAYDQLAALPEVDPAKIGIVGVGSGGPAALWAARIIGGSAPVLAVHAPATLAWDGPYSGNSNVPQGPWPSTLFVADRFGASLDPWMSLESLSPRLRWIDPRGGDGQPWKGPVALPGTIVDSLAAGLSR